MEDVVKLREEGKSFREIANMLGISVSTAYKRYMNAMRKAKGANESAEDVKQNIADQEDEQANLSQKEPRETDGELASKAFALFEQGMKPSQVVVKEKLSPDVVRSLYEQYIGMNDDCDNLCFAYQPIYPAAHLAFLSSIALKSPSAQCFLTEFTSVNSIFFSCADCPSAALACHHLITSQAVLYSVHQLIRSLG